MGPRVMRLNLAALDAHGIAVSDLKGEELQISDAGKPQQIVYFRRDDNVRNPGAKQARRDTGNDTGEPNPRAILVLFDLLNENFSHRGYGASELVHAVQKLETTDYLYLYLLAKDGSIFPVRPVPHAGELLHPAGSWAGQLHEVLDNALRAVTQMKTVDMKLTLDYIPATYQALGAMARQMMLFPGRKSLVWITQGLPLYFRDDTDQIIEFTPQLRSLSAMLDRHNVAVIPVVLNIQSGTTTLTEQDMLQTMADLTGGPPNLYSDIPGALDQALQTTRASYRIVYNPAAKNWDGKFHKIKATCTRAGVRLQTQQGYLADPSQLMPAPEQQGLIEEAMASPFDIREIGMHSSIGQSGPVKDHLQIRVNLSDVLLLRSGEKYQGELAVRVIRFYAGNRTTVSSNSINLDLTGQERDTLMTDGLLFNDKDPVSSDLEKVRIVVFDSGSGSIGALNVMLP